MVNSQGESWCQMKICSNLSLTLNAPSSSADRSTQGAEILNSGTQVKPWSEKPPGYLLEEKIWKELAFNLHAGTQLISRAAEHSDLAFSSGFIDPECSHKALECCRAASAPPDTLAAPSPDTIHP